MTPYEYRCGGCGDVIEDSDVEKDGGVLVMLRAESLYFVHRRGWCPEAFVFDGPIDESYRVGEVSESDWTDRQM